MAHLTRTALAGTTLAFALLLTACGGDTEAPEPATTSDDAAVVTEEEAPQQEPADDAVDEGVTASLPDPCLLLTPADIEAATGMAVSKGVADPERQTSYSSLCQWDEVGGTSFVAVAMAPDTVVPYEEGEDEVLGTIAAIAIPGADEAYLIRTGITLGMSVDGTYVSIAFNGEYDGEQGGGTKAIAALVAAHMG